MSAEHTDGAANPQRYGSLLSCMLVGLSRTISEETGNKKIVGVGLNEPPRGNGSSKSPKYAEQYRLHFRALIETSSSTRDEESSNLRLDGKFNHDAVLAASFIIRRHRKREFGREVSTVERQVEV